MTKTKGFGVSFLCFVLQLILVAVFVPLEWFEKAADVEYRWMDSVYSDRSMTWFNDTVGEWHYTITRESGIADAMKWYFLPEVDAWEQNGAVKEMDIMGQRWYTPYMQERGRSLDLMVETILYRVATLWVWIPLFVLVMVPALTEGILERKIKQHTFRYPSPLKFKYGGAITAVTTILLIFGFTSPLPTPPLLFPIGILTCVAVIGVVMIGNLPKRI